MGQSTNYGKIPKFIERSIQKNYEYHNVFYHYFDPDKNKYLIWFYDGSTVYWKLMDKTKVKKSGSFSSSGSFDGETINAINKTLNNSITEFEKGLGCMHVLDGSTFGYVFSVDNKEIVGSNSISITECLKENKSVIAQDFMTIFNLNFKVHPA